MLYSSVNRTVELHVPDVIDFLVQVVAILYVAYTSMSCRFVWPHEDLLRPQEVDEFDLGQVVEFLSVFKQNLKLLEILHIGRITLMMLSSCCHVNVPKSERLRDKTGALDPV